MRRNLFERYIPEAALAISKISDVHKVKIEHGLEKMLKKGLKEVDGEAEEEVELNEEETEKIRSKEKS